VIQKLLFKFRLFSNARKEPYLLFYKVLGFYPRKIAYYELAMRHRSASVPTADGIMLSNERLEFLGDAVLNSVVTDILYRRFENQREGFLTNTRSKIVKRESLNRIALEIGLDKLMLASKHLNLGENNNNLYGNALEALFGAIYLDYGYKKCKSFVENSLLKNFIDMDKVAADEVNFKSKLLEWSQKNKFRIDFVLLNEELSSHNNHLFHTQLLINGKALCEATGRSKKESHQHVALKALTLIEENPTVIEEKEAKKQHGRAE